MLLLLSVRVTLFGFYLQDSLASPVPSELADSYFLEEWERLQFRWAELHHQRRTFEKERQSFTDAAIRLSHDVRWRLRGILVIYSQRALCPNIRLYIFSSFCIS